MNFEDKIINIFSSHNKFIGDDCAYIKETKQLISTDSIIENTHFNLNKFSPNQIAHRLFVSNYSDIQSSGGIPQYALFNISFPKNKNKVALSISKQLRKISKNNKVDIIGGDTTSSENIYLSLTLISKKIDKSKILTRSKAKLNDEIYLFKNIGFSKLGFLNIFANFKLSTVIKKKSQKQFLSPVFYKYYDLFNSLPISSSIDISDGLYKSLKELSHKSKKKFFIDNLFDVNPSLYRYFKNNDKYENLILTSGEEYVPLFTIKKNIINKRISSLFKNKGIELIKIGKVSKGKGVKLNISNSKKINYFDHFNKNYLKL